MMFQKKEPKEVETLPKECPKCNKPIYLKKLKRKGDHFRAKMEGEKHEHYYHLDPDKQDQWEDDAVDLFFRCEKCGDTVKSLRYWRAWEMSRDGSDRELPNKKKIKLKLICLEHGPRSRKLYRGLLEDFVDEWQEKKGAKMKKAHKKVVVKAKESKKESKKESEEESKKEE